jgi:superfamily II DNA or RNA helicase
MSASAVGTLALVTSIVQSPSLRSYQTESVDKIRAAFALFLRVLFCLPTGGGKTVIFAYMRTERRLSAKQR